MMAVGRSCRHEFVAALCERRLRRSQTDATMPRRNILGREWAQEYRAVMNLKVIGLALLIIIALVALFLVFSKPAG